MVIFGILCIIAAVILGYALNEFGGDTGPMMEGVIPCLVLGMLTVCLFLAGVFLLIGGLVKAAS